MMLQEERAGDGSAGTLSAEGPLGIADTGSHHRPRKGSGRDVMLPEIHLDPDRVEDPRDPGRCPTGKPRFVQL